MSESPHEGGVAEVLSILHLFEQRVCASENVGSFDMEVVSSGRGRTAGIAMMELETALPVIAGHFDITDDGWARIDLLDFPLISGDAQDIRTQLDLLMSNGGIELVKAGVAKFVEYQSQGLIDEGKVQGER